MKTPILLLLIVAFLPSVGQSTISLDDCYLWARENYPNLKQTALWHEINGLKKENMTTLRLPQLMVHGQATYQSDVPSIGISLPGLDIPSVSKDQYKVYAEVKQAIWDGGVSEATARLEDAVLQSTLSQLEVELYSLNEKVLQAFFTIMAMDQQKKVLAAQRVSLQEKLQAVQSGIENQMVERSAALALEAEILLLHQNETELEAGRRSALQTLSILTGRAIDDNMQPALPDPAVGADRFAGRPETGLFAMQTSQLESQLGLVDKNRNPKIFGFGQAGYGKPGLNMLSNESDSFCLAGIGFSWNPFDWKNSARQKQVIRLQQELIARQSETFNQQIALLLAQQNEQIKKLQELLETDARLVSLRSEIAQASFSKFENEAITASGYIRDVQAETIAKLHAEWHRIQLNEARERFQLIKGKRIR